MAQITFPYHPSLLDHVCLSPALKIFAANSQIQVLFGSGISCSGAQSRSPKILWRLMASNSCFQSFGFACCQQEEGAAAQVGGFVQRDVPMCAATNTGCVCSVPEPAAGAAPPAAPWVSLGHARLLKNCQDTSMAADLLPVLLLHLLTW